VEPVNFFYMFINLGLLDPEKPREEEHSIPWWWSAAT